MVGVFLLWNFLVITNYCLEGEFELRLFNFEVYNLIYIIKLYYLLCDILEIYNFE